jgi:hypothetical protein
MKTPMQQMHEFLCKELEAKNAWQDYPHIENAILKCEELMKDEKEVIDDAYLCGLNRGVAFQQSQEMGVLCEWPSDRDYYEETFNIKEE